MMKRLTCTLAALALVMAISIPASAEFKGRLFRDLPWMLEITNTSSDDIAATIYYLGRNLEVVEIVTVPAGATVQTNIPKPGRGVRRAIVEVDLPVDGTARVRMVQGGLSFLDDIMSSQAGDSFRFVFHVVD